MRAVVSNQENSARMAGLRVKIDLNIIGLAIDLARGCPRIQRDRSAILGPNKQGRDGVNDWSGVGVGHAPILVSPHASVNRFFEQSYFVNNINQIATAEGRARRQKAEGSVLGKKEKAPLPGA